MFKLLLLTLTLAALFYRQVEASTGQSLLEEDPSKPNTCIFKQGNKQYELQVGEKGILLENCLRASCGRYNRTLPDKTIKSQLVVGFATTQVSYGNIKAKGCTLINEKETRYPDCRDPELSCTGEKPLPVG